jgi:hypothetical protein
MMVYKVSSQSPSPTLDNTDNLIVLGFHHSRRSRILRRRQATQLGGQGVIPRGGQAWHSLPGVRLRTIAIPATVHAQFALLRCRPLSSRYHLALFVPSMILVLHILFYGIGWCSWRTSASAKCFSTVITLLCCLWWLFGVIKEDMELRKHLVKCLLAALRRRDHDISSASIVISLIQIDRSLPLTCRFVRADAS